MTFHTFECCDNNISGIRFQKIHSDLKNTCNKYFKDSHIDGRYICTALSNSGIDIYLYKRSIGYYGNMEVFVYNISYRVNPIRMFVDEDYISLYSSKDADKIKDRFNSLVLSLSGSLSLLEECNLVRFDFCVNIEFDSAESVRDCINLINRSYYSDWYKQKSEGKRKKYFKEEATFTRPDRVQISFYDKRIQLENNGIPYNYPNSILRCEIRCFRTYIKDLYKKYNIKSIEEFLTRISEIGRYVFNFQLKKLHLSGRYFGIKELEEHIESSCLKYKTKKNMLHLLSLAAMHKSIREASFYIRSEEFNKSLKYFQKLSLSAMPLPHRLKLPSGLDLITLCLQFADR